MQGQAALSAALPWLLEGAGRTRGAACREGHLTLLKYLPHAAPNLFREWLPQVGGCLQ